MAKKFQVPGNPFVSAELRDSKQTDLIQSAGLLLGAVGFTKNGLHLLAESKRAKVELAACIAAQAGLNDRLNRRDFLVLVRRFAMLVDDMDTVMNHFSGSNLPGNRFAFRLAAGLGFALVALGAFGAHLLEDSLRANQSEATWHTAVFYHAIHAVALLALAACGRTNRWTTILWACGVLLFSGSLYVYALSQIRWLVFVTPFGGLGLIAGWLVLLIRGR
jgi:uncharacterized membrane protein YgdD (TMEM256/DUF423 family)